MDLFVNVENGASDKVVLIHGTSYDAIEKKHWLSVYRQNLAIRFLLKDHGESMNRRVHDSQQIENQIYQAVDQMISTIDQSDMSLKFTGDKN